MKSKKLLVMVLVLLAGGIAFAQYDYKEGVDFVQFTKADFNSYNTVQGREGFWEPARMITLNVQKGSTVYIANYVDSWYTDIKYDLGDPDFVDANNLKIGYDMSAGKYGYRYAEVDSNGNARPVGDIYYGDGSTQEIAFVSPDGTRVRTTAGYLLGTFDKDAEIFLVMSPRSNLGTVDTEVNTYDLVDAPDGDPSVNSYLASRQVNTKDLTGQTRVNLGTIEYYYDDNGNVIYESGVRKSLTAPHEFVIGYVADPSTPEPPSGQPLPGVLTSCLVALGATGIAARRRKHSRK